MAEKVEKSENILEATTGEQQPDSSAGENSGTADSTENIEALEEAKLRSKYPNINRPMAGHSAFLQKRLAKGQKYFDSGDYQMAKQKPLNKSRLPPLVSQSTGEAIPTPESVPVRKTSIIQQSKLTSTTSTAS